MLTSKQDNSQNNPTDSTTSAPPVAPSASDPGRPTQIIDITPIEIVDLTTSGSSKDGTTTRHRKHSINNPAYGRRPQTIDLTSPTLSTPPGPSTVESSEEPNALTPIPLELRLLIMENCDSWQDFMAFRHSDKINLLKVPVSRALVSLFDSDHLDERVRKPEFQPILAHFITSMRNNPIHRDLFSACRIKIPEVIVTNDNPQDQECKILYCYTRKAIADLLLFLWRPYNSSGKVKEYSIDQYLSEIQRTEAGKGVYAKTLSKQLKHFGVKTRILLDFLTDFDTDFGEHLSEALECFYDDANSNINNGRILELFERTKEKLAHVVSSDDFFAYRESQNLFFTSFLVSHFLPFVFWLIDISNYTQIVDEISLLSWEEKLKAVFLFIDNMEVIGREWRKLCEREVMETYHVAW